ncbi:gag/pol protein [Cucumis melo var. makuwa]|uniref:Gag/pol protein n=1 Tax=Cucumis melo var. makuwa TaxID=1194695 RepID=A0A5A7VE43_CUCMM|nr:gag/pol protein [Cucumis melo var. makuwa]TYK20854.1 gag/pol protein [Cucumis melo var. makuwa]
MKEGTFVREHVLDMMMHFNIDEVNGGAIDKANQVSFILESLPKSFKPFQTNASLNKIEFNWTTLLNELRQFQNLFNIDENLNKGKGKEVEANVATTKGKFKRGSSSRSKTGPSKPNRKIEKKGKGKTSKQTKGKKTTEKGKCYHCGENGHWLRNCPKYLAQKKVEKEAQDRPSSSTKVVDKTRNIGQTHPSQELGEPRRSGRVVRQPDRYLGLCEAQIIIPDDGIEDPLTYKQAMNDVDCDQWIKAMNLKMESMYSNFVWTLVDQSNDNVDEPSVYKRIINSIMAFLVLYVDDILLIGNDVGHLTDIKKWLATQFQMKDLGNAQYKMQNSKKSLLPYRYGIHLSKEQCPKTPQEVEDMSNIPYASTVGSLMYAMLCIRPDICYSVGIVSRYQFNPGRDHQIAIKNILKYLRRTKDYMLVYGSKDLILTGYTDSDFQIDKDARKSTLGSVFIVNEGAVVWRSINQYCIADSTMGAEYIAGCEAAKEALQTHENLEVINEESTLKVPSDQGNHTSRDVIVTKISSEQNMVDSFTKAIAAKVFESHLHGFRFTWVVTRTSGRLIGIVP